MRNNRAASIGLHMLALVLLALVAGLALALGEEADDKPPGWAAPLRNFGASGGASSSRQRWEAARRQRGGSSGESFGPPTQMEQHYSAAAHSPAGVLGMNAKEFGAVGDGRTDDTFALQKAIAASQKAGRALLIPAGTYLISRQLNVSCMTPELGCADRRPGEAQACCHDGRNYPLNNSCCTHQPAHIRGEGQALTHILATTKIKAVFDMGAVLTTNPGSTQPRYNTTGYHEISDLHVQCHIIEGPKAPTSGGADYGIYAPGITNSLFSRIRVNYARVSGARLFYCWINRFDNVNFNYNTIGIHSACNNLRVTGGNFDGHDIAGIVVDGGNAIEIDSNCIEGNSGPAVIVSGGIWGGPMGVSYSNNYHESNNQRPGWWLARGKPVEICTDMLINGGQWNQSFIDRRGPPWGADDPVGELGNGMPTVGISFTGNHGSPPAANEAPHDTTPCLNYAAVTAVAATGLEITHNQFTNVKGDFASGVGALLRLGTDFAVWGTSNVVLNANTAIAPYGKRAEYFGWTPLIELVDDNRSIPAGEGEVPLFTLEAGEVSQRNFYDYRGAELEPIAAVCGGAGNTGSYGYGSWRAEPEDPGHNARFTVKAHCSALNLEQCINPTGPPCTGDCTMCGGMLQQFNLSDTPDMQGTPMYLAFEVMMDASAKETQLSLMIDPGNGIWQYSNSTLGLGCSKSLGPDCEHHDTSGWHMRSFQATMQRSGIARFAVALAENATATISGIAIAPIGTKWKGLGFQLYQNPGR